MSWCFQPAHPALLANGGNKLHILRCQQEDDLGMDLRVCFKGCHDFPPPFSEIESKGFISYSFPPIRSDTLNLYSCVFHWTGTSPATWSEGNKSSELHQALCHSMQ